MEVVSPGGENARLPLLPGSTVLVRASPARENVPEPGRPAQLVEALDAETLD